MKTLKKIMVGLAVLLLVALAGLEVYTRLPAGFAVPELGAPADATALVILFHGSGGREEPTLKAVEQRFRQLAAAEPGTAVIRFIWSPWADNLLRAWKAGQHVGAELGHQVASLHGLRYIHLVGHSAGAYPMDAFCRAYRAAAKQPARIDMTFLDPIGIAGLFDASWGARNHGACADYAEVFINSDDPVRGTNEPLQQAWNIDVTQVASRQGYRWGGHRWPVQYYLDQLSAADLDPGAQGQAGRPRGAIDRR